MKQRPVRKLLALVLSLLLVFAFTPVAFAAESDVAEYNGTTYPTIADAIESAKASGGIVNVILSTSENVTIPQGANITLNINDGITLSNDGSSHTITNNGTLTITGSGTVDNTVNGKAALYNGVTGSATIEGGTFTRSQEKGSSAAESGNNSFYTIQNHGKMEINDCQVLNDGSFSSLLLNGFYNGSQENQEGNYHPSLTINGGTFSGGLNTIKNDDYGELVINDATVTNVAQAAILNWHETTINGGSFASNGEEASAVILNGYLSDNMDAGALKITGGTFTSENSDSPSIAQMQSSGSTQIGTVEISGGELNGAVDLTQSPGGGSVMISGNASVQSVRVPEESNPVDLEISGGSFEEEPEGTYVTKDALVVQIDSDKYYVGDAAMTAISGAKETITVLNGTEITGVQEGVKVTNNTGKEITVNDQTVEVGDEVTIPKTETPVEPSKPSSSFTEPEYYPDYDEDVDYLPPVEDEEEEEKASLYMVTCRTLNVRMGPGTSYSKLGTLSRGTLISGEYENGWVKFTYNGQTAYSSADYLMQVDGDLSGLHVTCRTLNVRAGAGTNFDILGTLSRGTEISVRDVLPGWYEIDFLGGIGYVSSAYIG